MNILFLLRGTAIGGLEVVTQYLAYKFIEEGHHVGIFVFRTDPGASIIDRLDKRIKVYQQNDYSVSKSNVNNLRTVLIDEGVDVIINQWGLPLTPIRVTRSAARGLKVKIISVYHNAPNANGRIIGLTNKLALTQNPIKRCILRCMRLAFRLVTGIAMRYIYRQSDCFLVLSECYKKNFQDFIYLHNTSKLRCLTNPVTIDQNGFYYDAKQKRKEIIFVGRLDRIQKRVYRVINTWNLMEERHPEWGLTIIGDGPDRPNLEAHVSALNLKHVQFKGFQNPLEYYKRASILILTSEFEGFPLVLAEAMCFGTVPVVFDSFAAIRDIIDNGKNGVIVPKVFGEFSDEQMVKGVEVAIADCEHHHAIAEEAIKKSMEYSLDEIYGKWMKLFEEI